MATHISYKSRNGPGSLALPSFPAFTSPPAQHFCSHSLFSAWLMRISNHKNFLHVLVHPKTLSSKSAMKGGGNYHLKFSIVGRSAQILHLGETTTV